MKKAMKLVVFVLCVALCATVFSCGSSGGGGGGKAAGELSGGTLATGEWEVYVDESDGGNSTATLTVAEEVIDGETVTTYTLKGNVTTQFQYGFCGLSLNPDPATMEVLKTAKSFSFKVLGDGKQFSFKFKTSDVKDFGPHERLFRTEPGKPVTIQFDTKQLIQPGWAQYKRLNTENVTGLDWQTHESWRKSPTDNPFEVKLWDFKVYN